MIFKRVKNARRGYDIRSYSDKVDNLSGSRAFYEAVFKTLGHRVGFEIENIVVGFGTNIHDMFEVRQADENTLLSKSVHIAFIAKDEPSVRDFHSTALAHGALDNGKPGPRPEYEPGYFAAFVIDPNGHNLEAVFKV